VPIIGVPMYGLGKALDADGGRGDELRWWYDGALAGIDQLGL
jgi:hypothetical protein